jgi:HSP20 family protein
MSPFSDVRDLADDIRRMFAELGRTQGAATGAEFEPPLDVQEHGDAVEIVVDLPGVRNDDVRVLIKGNTVLIAGEKLSPSPDSCPGATFHLIERGFGRFARVVRVTGAIDGNRARASLVSGELRVTVPKIDERRGHEIRVRIEPA